MKPSMQAPASGPQPLNAWARRLSGDGVGAVVSLGELLDTVTRAIGADGGVVVRRVGGADHGGVAVLAACPADPAASLTPPAWLTPLVLGLKPSGLRDGEAVVLALREPSEVYGAAASRHAVLLPLDMRPSGGDDPGVEGPIFVAFLVASRNRAAAEACRQKLDLCGSLFARFFHQQATAEERRRNKLLSVAMAVLSAVGAHSSGRDRFRGAATALVNEVAARFRGNFRGSPRGSRVTVGVLRGRYVKAVAMSRTEQLDRKTKLVQAIESAMEECLDQDQEVLYPAGPDAESSVCVAREAKRLSVEFGRHHVLSLPLRRPGSDGHDDEPEAVLTVEVEPASDGAASGSVFTPEAAEALRLTCNLVAPLFFQLHDRDRWLGAKAAAEARRAAAWAVGPRHTWAKLAAVAGCLLLLFVTLYPAPHRVSAPFVLQPQERQLVVAPFDGYLKAVHVEPGDRVVPGRTLLAELETAELRLQLAEKLAARVQHLKEADLARREGKTAEVQIAEAEAERAAAEIALLEHQIDKASLRSPLAGVVQEGDHKRKTGGAVSKGEVLFEVAPPDVLKAELRVPEDRVAELRVGQRGELAAAAQPGLYVPFIIEKIEPKAEVLDGQNVFRVWATLEAGGDGHAHGFRGKPGMEGVAKVEVGTTNYLWVWTHEAIEWVRMKLWI